MCKNRDTVTEFDHNSSQMQRAMAWERAKGELRSILVTYPSGDKAREQYTIAEKVIRNFIELCDEGEIFVQFT